MIKNFILLIVFSLLSLIFVEISLFLFGPYKILTTTKFEPSDAIYERPKNFIQKQPHPDIEYTIDNYFDKEGVKNYSTTLTSNKKKIIGFFGDSMTENINIDKQFEYTNILNNIIYDYNVVNYGIGGYNLEQAFVRYLKYKNHNFEYVVYFMMPGDHFERNLVNFDSNNQPLINKPEINIFFHLMGKLNITYLIIDGYFHLKYLFRNYHLTGIENYPSIYANKVYSEFYTDHERSEDNFDKILIYFNRVNQQLGRKFILILYPNEEMIKYVKERLKLNLSNIDYYILDKNLLKKNLQFKNDSHWNERGNLYFAKNLKDILKNYGIKFDNINFEEYEKKIDEFYKINKYR